MKNYYTKIVTTPAEAKIFRQVADNIYLNDPCWVKPFHHDIEAVFDPKRNERFSNGDAIRWILYADDKPYARIAAFYNNDDAAQQEQPIGGCGFFECPNDQPAADILFDTARQWLQNKGMTAMDGSVNFGDRMMWWGVLVEGFHMPLYGMNYNKPYYQALFESYGFQNYFNQYSYLRPISPDIHLPEALHAKAERLYADPEYLFTTFDKSNLKKMALDFMSVYNSGWAKFEGVKPLNEEHATAMFNSMKTLVDPQVLYMAYHKGQAVGFFVMVPDLNQILQHLDGKFGLFQKLKLLYMLKCKKSITRLAGLIFGVHGDYQGKGIEAAMIRQFEIHTQQRRAAGTTQYDSLIMSWIGDFNPVMMRMCESYVMAQKYIMHTTYRYLFDRTAEFKRCPRLGKK